MRRLAAALAALAIAGAAAGCGGGSRDAGPATAGTTAPATSATGADGCDHTPPDPAPSPGSYARPRRSISPGHSYAATLETSCGRIVIALDARRAPLAVNSFVFLARQGFFDGLTFWRVVPDYIIQGGDPLGNGTGGPGYTFDDELPRDGYPTGSVAMANAGPNTNGSQFFIVTGDASALPNRFTRFGRVTRGLDVARRIEGFADPTADPGDISSQRPTEPIYIRRVTITER